MKSKLRLRILLPAGILALLTLGFGAYAFTGTPGGEEAQTPAPLTRPAKKAAPAPSASLRVWAKKANAVCARMDEEAQALGTPQTRAELAQLLPQALNIADRSLAELRTLPTPRRNRAQIERMLGLFGQFIAVQRQATTALAADDIVGFARETGRAFRLNDRGNEIARRLGAVRCADDGSDDTELERERNRHRVVVAVVYSPDSSVDRLSILEARAGAEEAGAGFVAVNIYNAKELAGITVWYPVRTTPAVLVFARGEGALNLFNGYVDRETVAQAADNASV